MSGMGIHKRWSQKFVVRELAKCVFYPEGREDEFERSNRTDLLELGKYADGEISTYFPMTVWTGLRLLRKAAYDTLVSNGLAQPEIATGFLYLLRFQQIWHARELGRLRRGTMSGQTEDFARTGEAIAAAFSLGWTHQAAALADTALLLLPRRSYWTADPQRELEYQPYRMPFARFVLRLYAEFAGQDLPEPMPRHPYESPPYDLLMGCWRNPDPDVLVEPLLAVCDWHTHECMYSRSMDPGRRVDFVFDIYMGWPIEVHMVYRLRELLGLCNPRQLDHPLMQTPLAKYLPAWPQPADELLERVTRRALGQYPELAELV
jgi:hypothetical protein